MNNKFRLRQAWTIAQLELRRVFFSKRSFWVYLLALFPSVIFIGHGIGVKYQAQRFGARHMITPQVMDSIRYDDSYEDVLKKAGPPAMDNSWRRRRHDDEESASTRFVIYFDGHRRAELTFENGVMKLKRIQPLMDLDQERQVFAGVFQYFYLRLAIFFGCLGIFMNLFRGEMLDKTLHFWFLGPARREVLLLGKYFAGLTAAIVIFTGGALVCTIAMLWSQDPSQVANWWNDQSGGMEIFRYALAAAFGCVGYGSVFLASGLLVRNPIIPAVVLLLWESIGGFLPATLQKVTVLYYLQSLCPMPAPMDNGAPALIRLLLSPAEPASAWVSMLGLLALTVLVLFSSTFAIRRLQIDYGTE